MPDPVLIAKAMAAAAMSAVAVVIAFHQCMRHSRLAPVGSVLGVAAGLCVGCWFSDVRPHWPPREDQDRFLLFLLPAALAIELAAELRLRRIEAIAAGKESGARLASGTGSESVAAGSGIGHIVIWIARVALAVGVTPILLYNSIYLSDAGGPSSREWTAAQIAMRMVALAVAMAIVWAALVRLASQSGGQFVTAIVALACAGASVTIMLSGYATGGQIGLPFAAALAAAGGVALVVSRRSSAEGLVGIGVVGLFGLLVVGRYFGELSASHAALLLVAPLSGWLTELPGIRRRSIWLRGPIRVALTAVPVTIALMLAQQKFVADSAGNSPQSHEASADDYMGFGK